MIDLDAMGRKFNTTDVISEITVCITAGQSYQDPLLAQGIRPTVLARLEELSQDLPRLDQDQVNASKRQEKCTDTVNRLMDEGISTLGRVQNLATDALLLTDPAALESLPSRSKVGTVSSMIKALESDAAFVKAHKEVMATTTAPPTLADELARDAIRLQDANKEQEAAKKAAEAATRELARARGEAYMLIKKVYEAGKVAFRKEASIKSLFKFQYLKRSGSSPAGTSTTDAAARKAGAKKAAEASQAPAEAKKAAEAPQPAAAGAVAKPDGKPKPEAESLPVPPAAVAEEAARAHPSDSEMPSATQLP